MVKVLRVETNAKLGMYAIGSLNFSQPECLYEMQEARYHPAPYEDAALSAVWNKICEDYEEKREWYFAFTDLNQLRNWIYKTDWRNELAKNGLKISVYELNDIEDYHFGDTQCIFKLHKAKQIDRFGFDEIYTKEI